MLAETSAPLATRCLLVPRPAGAIASIRVDSTGVVWILDNTGEVMRYERAQGDCLLHGTLATIGDGLAPVTDLEVDSFRDVDADAVGIANGDDLVLAAVDGFDMAPPAHRFDPWSGQMVGDLGAATEELREAATLADLAATTSGYLMLEPAGALFVLDLNGVTTRILTPTELFGVEAIISVGAIGDSTIWLATDDDNVWALDTPPE